MITWELIIAISAYNFVMGVVLGPKDESIFCTYESERSIEENQEETSRGNLDVKAA